MNKNILNVVPWKCIMLSAVLSTGCLYSQAGERHRGATRRTLASTPPPAVRPAMQSATTPPDPDISPMRGTYPANPDSETSSKRSVRPTDPTPDIPQMRSTAPAKPDSDIWPMQSTRSANIAPFTPEERVTSASSEPYFAPVESRPEYVTDDWLMEQPSQLLPQEEDSSPQSRYEPADDTKKPQPDNRKGMRQRRRKASGTKKQTANNVAATPEQTAAKQDMFSSDWQPITSDILVPVPEQSEYSSDYSTDTYSSPVQPYDTGTFPEVISSSTYDDPFAPQSIWDTQTIPLAQPEPSNVYSAPDYPAPDYQTEHIDKYSDIVTSDWNTHTPSFAAPEEKKEATRQEPAAPPAPQPEAPAQHQQGMPEKREAEYSAPAASQQKRYEEPQGASTSTSYSERQVETSPQRIPDPRASFTEPGGNTFGATEQPARPSREAATDSYGSNTNTAAMSQQPVNQLQMRQQSTPPSMPSRAEVEEYRQRLELRLLERYNNLPDYAGNVGRVEVVLSRPIEESLDGSRLRAEFDQLVYDPWGRRIPKLEEEYFVVTFAAGGAQQVRSDPSVRVGLNHEQGFSEQMPLTADPFTNVQKSKAFSPAPAPKSTTKKMADWWRPSFPELE